MKKLGLSLLMLVATFTLLAQEKENINLLDTEASWRKEAFRFPIPFAKAVDFDGVADVRFTKGWEDKNSPNFWSYAFGWKIAQPVQLSETALENYMQLYFDGLMNVVNKDKSKAVPPTTAVFTSTVSKDGVTYKGRIRMYDAFFTQEMMTLNAQVSYSYCTPEAKSIYLFKLSPQALEHPVWQNIHKATLRSDVCQ